MRVYIYIYIFAINFQTSFIENSPHLLFWPKICALRPGFRRHGSCAASPWCLRPRRRCWRRPRPAASLQPLRWFSENVEDMWWQLGDRTGMIFLGFTTVHVYIIVCYFIYIYNIHTYYCVLLSRKPITMCLIFVCMLWMMPCLHNFGSYKQCWHMVPGPLQAVRPVAADHVPAEGVPWSNFVPYVMYTSGSSAIIGNVSKTIINHIHPYPKSPLPTL